MLEEQDDSTSIAISVAIGVAVIFAVIFVLGLLCGLLGLLVEGNILELGGHEAAMWLLEGVTA